MTRTELLKEEIKIKPDGSWLFYYYISQGYKEGEKLGASNMKIRAHGNYNLFANTKPYIYKNDLIVGSMRSAWGRTSEEERQEGHDMFVKKYRSRPNQDHYAPYYNDVLSGGIPYLFEKIEKSKKKHSEDAGKIEFLEAMEITLRGFLKRIENYISLAESLIGQEGYDTKTLEKIIKNCKALTSRAPETFEEALQLIWFIHSAFMLENRYAMALGRLDQYLYPFYKNDKENNLITKEYATELFENVFMKIFERYSFIRQDDVVNIAIGGCDKDGKSSVNELSFCILTAVKNVNLPGPNLSARISSDCPDEFLDACLKVIGTGLGYPALMNDEVNIPALMKYGYELEDARNYSMVGCIENFITGMQPPWTDGRFDTPKCFEYVFNEGVGIVDARKGSGTGSISEIKSMDEFVEKVLVQLEHMAEEYINSYRSRHLFDPENNTQPFLSLFCYDCIDRAADLFDGGAKYPSVYGAAAMGIGTFVDSLAAIEKVVFVDKKATLEDVACALRANFEGSEELRELLLGAVKYGNNDDFADKWAVWFVENISRIFNQYRTVDNGYIYTLIAANVQNVSAGRVIAATPDGRLSGEPLSDAGSPTYGRDRGGPTTTVLSVTKPDYTCVGGGTVLNQKFSPSLFTDENRKKLLQLVRVYFARGGQEMQINSISRQTLLDAIENPEKYENLVVRVSGFSALYKELGDAVQQDILKRTEQVL